MTLTFELFISSLHLVISGGGSISTNSDDCMIINLYFVP